MTPPDLDPTRIRRRPFRPEHLGDLVAFCASDPQHRFNGVIPWVLTELVSSPEAILDLQLDNATILLAVVIDSCDNATSSAPLDLIAWRPPADQEAVLEYGLELAEAFARTGRHRYLSVEVSDTGLFKADMLERRGYHQAYRNYGMIRPGGQPVRRPARPLPEGYRWIDVDDERFEAYYRLLARVFADIPGSQVAPLEQTRELMHLARIPGRLLMDGERVVGWINVKLGGEDGLEGEVRTLGREPELRGAGLGEHILYEGMSLLERQGATRMKLDVTAENQDALTLYKRSGFEIDEVFTFYHLPVREG